MADGLGSARVSGSGGVLWRELAVNGLPDDEILELERTPADTRRAMMAAIDRIEGAVAVLSGKVDRQADRSLVVYQLARTRIAGVALALALSVAALLVACMR